MSAVEAWRMLGTADLDAIVRGLQPLAQAWAEEWLPGTRVALAVVDAHADGSLQTLEGEQWLFLKNGQGGLVAAVAYCSGLIGMLQRQAMATLEVPAGHSATGGIHGIPAALAQFQLRDLPARLARLPAGSARREIRYSHDPTLCPATRKAGGAVLVRLALERQAVRIWLPNDAVASWCRRPDRGVRTPLVPRKKALGGCSLAFRLQAGVAMLALPDLLALQPGNVIRLDTGPEQSMEMVTSDGPGFGRCYLGLQDGQPVIQLCN